MVFKECLPGAVLCKKARLCKFILIILQLANICFSDNEYSVFLTPVSIVPYLTPGSTKRWIKHYYILARNTKIKSFATECSLQGKWGKIPSLPNLKPIKNALSDIEV